MYRGVKSHERCQCVLVLHKSRDAFFSQSCIEVLAHRESCNAGSSEFRQGRSSRTSGARAGENHENESRRCYLTINQAQEHCWKREGHPLSLGQRYIVYCINGSREFSNLLRQIAAYLASAS